jgi:hypothetical protein
MLLAHPSIIIALILLTGGGFALISPTPMTTALAQEENNATTATTTITIDGDADSDTDGSVNGSEGGGNGNTSTSTTTTTAASSSSGIELSLQPVYQDRGKDEGQIPINQTHLQISFFGNGTLTLPNSTEPIRTTSSGSGIASMLGTFTGEVTLITEDGSENATATTYEIGRFNMQDGTGKGIAIAVFHTNSTGKLAPLDGMILVGQDEFPPDGTSFITFWEWQSGIPYVKMPSDLTQQSQMNATTTNTTTITSSPPSSTVIP